MMSFTHDIEGVFSSRIGGRGLSKEHFQETLRLLKGPIKTLRSAYDEGTLPLLHIPFQRKDLKEIENHVERFQDEFLDILILGTGGSSLGGQSLYAFAKTKRPRLHFLDNVDPHAFTQLFSSLDLHQTGVIAISKSGTTAETLCQLLICLHAWQKEVSAGCMANHFLIITEPPMSEMRQIAQQYHIPVVDHPPIGGRFSVLSPVGLLPAQLAGMNAEAIRQGAEDVLRPLLQDTLPNAESWAPAAGAAVQYALAKHCGLTSTVMLSYCDRLVTFTSWFRQLWAESLGKGGKGTTPIRAWGTVDQHSQLQLYLDGTRDKFFTLFTHDVGNEDLPVGAVDFPGLDYLKDRSMGDLLAAEARATKESLLRHAAPVRHIHIPHIDERTLGALYMHFMVETILAADLWDVNAFDQPAVEESKILTRQYMKEL